MNIQPIDLPSLLRAVTWPLITIIALAILWRPLTDLVKLLVPRINKISFGGFSLDMAQVQEMQPRAMDSEIRQLDAGLMPQSGTSELTAAVTSLVSELQSGGLHDYVVIDLGSDLSPRWLTSRLFLLCFLITLINRQLCLVFVETVGSVRKKFIGIASPESVRWAFARKYSWLESAGATAYATQVGTPPIGVLAIPVAKNQFDPQSGYLWTMIPNLIQGFLAQVRSTVAPPDNSAERSEWVSLDKLLTYEHAKWLNGGRIESLLGSDLSGSCVMLLPNQRLDDLSDVVLKQHGRFVAVVDSERTFRGLVDRSAVLEQLANDIARHERLNGRN